jgi:chromosome segregation ATPase
MSDPNQVQDLESQVRDLTTKFNDAKFVIERLKTKIEDQEEQLAIKMVEISELNAVLKAVYAARDKLDDQLQSSQESEESYRSKAECDSLRAQLQASQESEEYYRSKLVDCEREHVLQHNDIEERHRAEVKRLRKELTDDIDAERARFAHYEKLFEQLETDLVTMWCTENGRYTSRLYQVKPDPKTEADIAHNAQVKKDEVNSIKKMLTFFKHYFTDKPFRESMVKRFFTLVLKKYHSDKKGDAEVFKTLNNLWDNFTK